MKLFLAEVRCPRWPPRLRVPHTSNRQTRSLASTTRRWQQDHNSSSTSDLFNYTSGRWMSVADLHSRPRTPCRTDLFASHDEHLRKSQRRRPFNVAELKRLAAAAINAPATEVASLQKLGEGGFNRTFLVTMRDGFQLVARIPYPVTEPKYLLIASEVATIEYLRRRGFPVPRIYGYSATADNAVGTEYILMERAAGRRLTDRWFDLSEQELAGVVDRIVALEARLFALDFPASGSLFFERDLQCMETVRVPDEAGAVGEGRFCVGPEVTRGLWLGKRRILPVHRGPHTSPVDVLAAGARKEIVYLEEYGQPVRGSKHLPANRSYKQSPRDHINNLTDYLRVAPYLVPSDASLIRHTIRHPDLQPSNIFVNEDLEITGLIDWQYSTIRPLFLQCGVPTNLQSADGEIPSLLQEPRLPDGFDGLSEADQRCERELFRSRWLHYCYLTATAKLNPAHQAALTGDLGVLRRRLCHQAAVPWDGDNVTLKADLIQLTMNWARLVRSDDADDADASACPITYSQDEVNKCLQLNTAQVELDEQERLSREVLGVGFEGWVAAERYDNVKACEEVLKVDELSVADASKESILG